MSGLGNDNKRSLDMLFSDPRRFLTSMAYGNPPYLLASVQPSEIGRRAF